MSNPVEQLKSMIEDARVLNENISAWMDDIPQSDAFTNMRYYAGTALSNATDVSTYLGYTLQAVPPHEDGEDEE